MKFILAIITVLAVGGLWTLQKTEAASLNAEVNALRSQNRELEALHGERERLQRLRPGAAEMVSLQLAGAEHARLERELAAREPAAPRGSPAQLEVGRWLPPTAWKNRGQHTPASTVETVLWAAAGGDVSFLKNLFQLDDNVRARAEEILAQLPEASRRSYPTPGDLIAAFTTKAIPIGDAQLVWHHASGPDDAVACVFVKQTDPTAVAVVPATKGPPEKVPPMAAPNHRTTSAYLSLRRIDDSWRVVVPLSAVEKIAKELRGSASR